MIWQQFTSLNSAHEQMTATLMIEGALCDVRPPRRSLASALPCETEMSVSVAGGDCRLPTSIFIDYFSAVCHLS
jgi:hypothetical protein